MGDYPNDKKLEQTYVKKTLQKQKLSQEYTTDMLNDFIHIIKGDAKINFDGYFNCESATVDPKMLVESGIDAMKFTSKQEAEWIKKFEENGDYDVKMQIGKDWKTNPNISDNMIFGNSYI